jgi:hypothetical protein
VRTVEEVVTLGDDDTAPVARRAPRAGNRRPQLDDLAADLSDRLETRVRIALGQRKGRLTVEFASVDDLNRILTPCTCATRGTEPTARRGTRSDNQEARTHKSPVHQPRGTAPLGVCGASAEEGLQLAQQLRLGHGADDRLDDLAVRRRRASWGCS